MDSIRATPIQGHRGQGHSLLIVLILFVLSAGPAVPAESPIIGVVRTVKGTAYILRNQQVIPATVGFKLRVNDGFQTKADGSLGLILRDDSLLSMGPNSQLILDKFVYAPQEGKLGFLIKILRGTANYISGLIGKLSPGTAKFETPVATIGIRGTHFVVKAES